MTTLLSFLIGAIFYHSLTTAHNRIIQALDRITWSAYNTLLERAQRESNQVFQEIMGEWK